MNVPPPPLDWERDRIWACQLGEQPPNNRTDWNVSCSKCRARWLVDRIHLSPIMRATGDTVHAMTSAGPNCCP